MERICQGRPAKKIMGVQDIDTNRHEASEFVFTAGFIFPPEANGSKNVKRNTSETNESNKEKQKVWEYYILPSLNT